MRVAEIRAVLGYLWLTGATGFGHGLLWTVYLLWQERVGMLTPQQMVLMGTVAEITILLCEVPTGVVADTVSRRLSFALGYLIIGVGFLMQAAFPVLGVIVVGAALWGLGETFISGAREAWVADEIRVSGGPVSAAEAFARGNTFRLCGAVLGAWAAAAFGFFGGLSAAIWAGSIAFMIVGVLCLVLLPERGFHRASDTERSNWTHMKETLRGGIRLAKTRFGIRAVMLTTFFVGLASEGFDRLWSPHMNKLGFPDVMPDVVWLAVLASVPSLLAALAGAWIVRSGIPNDMGRTLKALFWIHCGVMVAVLGFAFSGSFLMAAGFLVLGRVLRRVDTPLITAWVNESAEPSVRATVLSFQGQAHAAGEIGGGPIAAAVAAASGVRAALAFSGAMVGATLVSVGNAIVKTRRAGQQDDAV